MAVVKFLTETKYNRVFYPPHIPVEVEEGDVDALVSLGAIIVSRETKKPAEDNKTSAVADKATKTKVSGNKSK